MEKIYCYDCDRDVDPIAKKSLENHTLRGKEFTIEMEAFYCPYCKNEISHEEILDKQLKTLWNGYLNIFNLSLNSFKYIRSSTGLSQELFALSLGWSKKSIARYENNDEIPKGEYFNTYLKLNNNPDYILECLYKNKINLTDLEYSKILNRLDLELNVKARNAILYILKNNQLYVLQLNKNMFAIDFLNYKNNNTSITKFKYLKMARGPVIDGYKEIINKKLKSGEIKIAETNKIEDNDCFKYIAVWNYNECVFTEEELNILKEIKKKLKNKTGKNLSDWSHEFKGWIETPMGKPIDYEKYAKYFNC